VGIWILNPANFATAAAVGGISCGAKGTRQAFKRGEVLAAEALQNFNHILFNVSRILSSAKDFYFWRSSHIACNVNADSER
jgi:hypothetical protein